MEPLVAHILAKVATAPLAAAATVRHLSDNMQR
jgi:hypothetical protein